MTSEPQRISLADYLNDHPTEAEKLRKSISSMVSQFELFKRESVPTLADTLVKLQQAALESLRPVYVPPLPDTMFEGLRKTLRAIYPSNWPADLPDYIRIEEVLEKDGIPIVHIPRAEIVQAICDADDYEARVEILKNRRTDIAEDCKEALQGDFDPIIEKQLPLARQAVDVYQAGYPEAAQALAVSVCDTYLKQMFKDTSYKSM